MFFGSLLIYLVLWIPCYLLVIPRDIGLIKYIYLPGLYLISTLIFLLVLFFIKHYQPEVKTNIKNVIGFSGTKWIAFVTSITCIVLIFVFFSENLLSFFIIGIIFPILIVSFINSLSVDIHLKVLSEDDIVPKIILPEILAPEYKPSEYYSEIKKSYQWVYKGQEYNLDLGIRNELYKTFKNRKRVLDCKLWVEEYVIGGICGEIRELAFKLLHDNQLYKTYDEVSYILSFVQQIITYENDIGEYPKYPIETLVEEKGDCEDYAMLGAAILKIIGYEVSLLFLPGHAALGVAGAEGLPGTYIEYDGINYYYCEMTAEGWQIGHMPEKYKTEEIEVIPVPSLLVI